jgi:hypothetical protein
MQLPKVVITLVVIGLAHMSGTPLVFLGEEHWDWRASPGHAHLQSQSRFPMADTEDEDTVLARKPISTRPLTGASEVPTLPSAFRLALTWLEC